MQIETRHPVWCAERRKLLSALLGTLASTSACSEPVTAARNQPLLRVTPRSVLLSTNAGAFAPLTVSAVDADNRALSLDRASTFTVRDTSVAAVDGTGRVSSRQRAGSTHVIVSAVVRGHTLVDSVAVGVLAPGRVHLAR